MVRNSVTKERKIKNTHETKLKKVWFVTAEFQVIGRTIFYNCNLVGWQWIPGNDSGNPEDSLIKCTSFISFLKLTELSCDMSCVLSF